MSNQIKMQLSNEYGNKIKSEKSKVMFRVSFTDYQMQPLTLFLLFSLRPC